MAFFFSLVSHFAAPLPWQQWLCGLGVVLGLLTGPAALAQALRGVVTDRATGQPVVGAVVRFEPQPALGTLTDGEGKFALDLSPQSTGNLLVELPGFKPYKVAVAAGRRPVLTVRLGPLSVALRSAQVIGQAGQADPERHLRGGQLGEVVLPMAALRVLPVLFGEADPVKTLALLPGVQTGGEGQTGLYVRGGGQDQNLTLLDGATLYNAGHLLNFFSVFNPDAVQTVALLKTPEAHYGGRLSSVLRVEGRDGTPDSVRTQLGLGLVASRLSVEGPLWRPRPNRDSAGGKRPATFLLAARRTYLDVLARPFQQTAADGIPYYFYDLNGRLAWRPTRRDKLALTLYHGRDAGSFNLAGGRLRADFSWGNTVGALTWRHAFGPRLRLLTTATATEYRFRFVSRFDVYQSQLLVYVRDLGGQAELEWTPTPRYLVRVGAAAIAHTLRPRAGEASTVDGQRFSTTRVQTKYAQEATAWLSTEWTLTDRLLLVAGLRFSGLRQRGPYTQYTFDAAGARVLDSLTYAAGQTAARFTTPEPRLSGRYTLPGGRAAVKAAYARTAQYLHLVSQATSALPLDVWVPASALVPPQRAHNFSLGYFRTLGAGQAWELSAEAYYRRLSGQLEYRDGYVAGPVNRDQEYEFVRGRGRSWGLELLARRTTGQWQGWVAYTLAWAQRTFPDLNGGTTYPFRFDQRHNLNLVASYAWKPRWRLGATFTCATGQATTMPARRYLLDNNVRYQYGPRNGFRMPTQHRLDLAATWQRPARRWGQTRWQFSVYNAYGRRNPWFYYLAPTGDIAAGSARLTAQSVALFPYPVPAITWEVAF